ncbi:hypothetical protein SAMD00019534_090800 [Acytostelium subglobosum LB1]|uniref:hypothetical protein n=1 Tax=Acytostelium subglobosum LB1 TaxID=1410327 RepID=UPI0006448C81|nr:hypothetical protein SAMD00019534_090800 [Acytostelium subglobosum LB1]GAM25905.1 hypothetical protein SAMD00019534_090800 [Acytostelium subglobosum LB1]|eukprot:XP_012750948.1 hypothetical protein SAMD00019534_090800 [Acytostelium subglobosum LB1]
MSTTASKPSAPQSAETTTPAAIAPNADYDRSLLQKFIGQSSLLKDGVLGQCAMFAKMMVTFSSIGSFEPAQLSAKQLKGELAEFGVTDSKKDKKKDKGDKKDKKDKKKDKGDKKDKKDKGDKKDKKDKKDKGDKKDKKDKKDKGDKKEKKEKKEKSDKEKAKDEKKALKKQDKEEKKGKKNKDKDDKKDKKKQEKEEKKKEKKEIGLTERVITQTRALLDDDKSLGLLAPCMQLIKCPSGQDEAECKRIKELSIKQLKSEICYSQFLTNLLECQKSGGKNCVTRNIGLAYTCRNITGKTGLSTSVFSKSY